MTAHKFKAGQDVTFLPSRSSGALGGRFAVVKLLPEDRGVCQYRVKCAADGHERIVLESELAP